MFFFNNSSCCCNRKTQCVRCQAEHSDCDCERDRCKCCCKCCCCRKEVQRPVRPQCCCKCCNGNMHGMMPFDNDFDGNDEY